MATVTHRPFALPGVAASTSTFRAPAPSEPLPHHFLQYRASDAPNPCTALRGASSSSPDMNVSIPAHASSSLSHTTPAAITAAEAALLLKTMETKQSLQKKAELQKIARTLRARLGLAHLKVKHGCVEKPFKQVKSAYLAQIKESRRIRKVSRIINGYASPNPFLVSNSKKKPGRTRKSPTRRTGKPANSSGEDQHGAVRTHASDEGSDEYSPTAADKLNVPAISRVLSNPARYPKTKRLKALHGEAQDVRQNASRRLKELRALSTHVASGIASNTFVESSRVAMANAEATHLANHFQATHSTNSPTVSFFFGQPSSTPAAHTTLSYKDKDLGHSTATGSVSRGRPRGRPRGRGVAKTNSTPRPSTYVPTGRPRGRPKGSGKAAKLAMLQAEEEAAAQLAMLRASRQATEPVPEVSVTQGPSENMSATLAG
ncbi:hypothetical protein SeMB42_g01888 [Synchytrium endobioticum]|uniref:Uncharacterized protein n=1 Tax=Synchytrium endobioticum TaxID=286115 RepID=A0A507CR76_9FUNG|nr:hypothetical protein SeLEV6574_g05981 [Synchytrium endobioticum]TPX51530.1 hypothetical protein SeMB42_g01888 [Synchytrium endobioticum]